MKPTILMFAQAEGQNADAQAVEETSKQLPEWIMQAQVLIREYALPVLGAIVVLIAALVISAWARRATEAALVRARLEVTLARFFGTMVRWAIMILGIVTCLTLFGFDMTSVAAVLGAAGIAIGLAMQGSLSNLASGVMLLVFRLFRVGDVVKIGGETGIVFAIDLFVTTIDTFDNRRIFIPNGQVFGNTIENITYHPIRRVDVSVGVSYEADQDATRAALMEAATSVSIRSLEKEPTVVVMDYGDSSVNWQVRIWAERTNFLDVRQATIRAIRKSLDAAGIEIPFPQMDVHLDRGAA
ncbi:MAG: mechanosensitive ion channel [Phycisphaerales bacterium]|nr:mechanosensitive ion channel [Phycisphaerales bacterium]